MADQPASCTSRPAGTGSVSSTVSVVANEFGTKTGPYPDRVNLDVSGEIWFWRGPSPFHFVTVPDEQCDALHAVSPMVSYGWGMIPVAARIGKTDWKTSLFPKDGGYIVPVKDAVRNSEKLGVGHVVTVRLTVDV